MLERLCPTRLTHHCRTTMTRHAKALNKTNELISLLAPTLSTINQYFSHLKLISMIIFASYSKHAKV
jgi:bacterioferritin (cytochrome b1)